MGLIVLLIAIGGGAGAVSRFGVLQISARYATQIPMGVLLCNIVGSLLIGMIAAFLIKTNLFGQETFIYIRTFFITGFLGGFTTFSSFSLEALSMLQKGEFMTAMTYVLISVVASVLMVAVGFYVVLGLYR